jgi:hypothetical protein
LHQAGASSRQVSAIDNLRQRQQESDNTTVLAASYISSQVHQEGVDNTSEFVATVYKMASALNGGNKKIEDGNDQKARWNFSVPAEESLKAWSITIIYKQSDDKRVSSLRVLFKKSNYNIEDAEATARLMNVLARVLSSNQLAINADAVNLFIVDGSTLFLELNENCSMYVKNYAPYKNKAFYSFRCGVALSLKSNSEDVSAKEIALTLCCQEGSIFPALDSRVRYGQVFTDNNYSIVIDMYDAKYISLFDLSFAIMFNNQDKGTGFKQMTLIDAMVRNPDIKCNRVSPCCGSFSHLNFIVDESLNQVMQELCRDMREAVQKHRKTIVLENRNLSLLIIALKNEFHQKVINKLQFQSSILKGMVTYAAHGVRNAENSKQSIIPEVFVQSILHSVINSDVTCQQHALIQNKEIPEYFVSKGSTIKERSEEFVKVWYPLVQLQDTVTINVVKDNIFYTSLSNQPGQKREANSDINTFYFQTPCGDIHVIDRCLDNILAQTEFEGRVQNLPIWFNNRAIFISLKPVVRNAEGKIISGTVGTRGDATQIASMDPVELYLKSKEGNGDGAGKLYSHDMMRHILYFYPEGDFIDTKDREKMIVFVFDENYKVIPFSNSGWKDTKIVENQQTNSGESKTYKLVLKIPAITEAHKADLESNTSSAKNTDLENKFKKMSDSMRLLARSTQRVTFGENKFALTFAQETRILNFEIKLTSQVIVDRFENFAPRQKTIDSTSSNTFIELNSVDCMIKIYEAIQKELSIDNLNLPFKPCFLNAVVAFVKHNLFYIAKSKGLEFPEEYLILKLSNDLNTYCRSMGYHSRVSVEEFYKYQSDKQKALEIRKEQKKIETPGFFAPSVVPEVNKSIRADPVVVVEKKGFFSELVASVTGMFN